MAKVKNLEVINREILRILSLYEQLSLLELWFEIGEAGFLEPMTKEQVSSRLESLMAKGLVKRVRFADTDTRWALERSSNRDALKISREAGDSQSRRKKVKKIPSIPSKKSKPKIKKTHFQLYAPEARSVALVGTFNEYAVDERGYQGDLGDQCRSTPWKI